jgi:hypothetical protein
MFTKRRVGAVTVLALLLAGCGAPASAPPTTTPTGTPQSPAPTTAAIATPTPEPSIDVAPLFAESIAALKTGVVTFDGLVIVGDIQVTMSGATTFSGPDSTTATTTALGGVSTTVETVKVAGRQYARTGDGPWLEKVASNRPDLTEQLLGDPSNLTDLGTEMRAGQRVHRLEADRADFDPAALLASVEGVSAVEADIAFFALDDGTPVGAILEVSWLQASDDGSVDGSMALEMGFSQLGRPQTIRAPADVWTSFASERWGYAFAHPADYDHSSDKGYDYFFGPGDSWLSSARGKTFGYTLNVIAKAEMAGLKKALGAKSGTNEALTMGGIKGRLVTVAGKSKDLGGRYTVYEAIVVKGKFAYYVAWFSPAGSEAADLATFRQLVSTFALTQ